MTAVTLINVFLIAGTATSCTYWLFYHFSSFIWSFNSTVPASAYVPWVRDILGNTGIQVYVLYLFMFLNLAAAFILNAIFFNIKKPLFKKIFIVLSLVLLFIFLVSIKFNVPVTAPATSFPDYMFVAAVFLVTLFLSLNYRARWISFFVFLMLFIILLSTATDIDRSTYVHSLAPAWRLLHGFGLKSYFQYDCFLPILTAGWVTFLPIDTLPLLGRLSYLALFFGAYLFAKNFFNNKQLAVYLLVSIVMAKVYGNLVAPDGILQVTPWRLDWWIVLLALAYWKTADHWIVGACMGLLIVFHHSFGCIYGLCYFSFILMRTILEMTDGKGPLTDVFKRSFFLYFRNLLIILAALLIYEAFIHPRVNIAVYYQQGGLGFLRIPRQSFYWYMPMVFASVFLLLCKNRPLLPRKFFATSIFLLSLAIGNSMYYFGRSHDNNIVNIAAILLMVFFLLLDLVHVELKRFSSVGLTRWIIPLTASLFVLVISYQYADRAIKLVDTQSYNIKHHRLVADFLSDFRTVNFPELRELTHSSPNVIFISVLDFYFYYFGGYSLPQNYNCYMYSWFIMKDYVDYLNDLLSKGFYIVANPREISTNADIINSLKARYFSNTEDLLVISNNPLRSFDQRLWSR